MNVLAEANAEITEELLEKIKDLGIKQFETLYFNDLDQGDFISHTLTTDEIPDEYSARVAIYRMMRPGEPPTEDSVKALFEGCFFSADRYDLGCRKNEINRRAYPKSFEKASGWMQRFYERVGEKSDEGNGILSVDDILAVVGILVELRNGRGEIDDIDHLGNRPYSLGW